MRNIIKLALLSLPLLLAVPAQALIELNLGYQGVLSNSGGGNWTVPGLTMSGAYGMQADLRFDIPLTGIGLGIRYGQLGLDGSASGATVSMKNTSYSAILAYRIINTGILFGPVVTYSLSNSASTLTNSLATPTGPVNAGSVSQYTAGLEFGLKFPILLAAEIGIGNLSMSGFSTQTLSGNPTKVDLSGTYARASIGLSF